MICLNSLPDSVYPAATSGGAPVRKQKSPRKILLRMLFRIALCSMLLLGGCTSTFLISKHCESGFFGEQDKNLDEMLCTQGDLKRILASTPLPEATANKLLSAHCIDHSAKQVAELYNALSKEQKDNLKYAFQLNGYEVNYKPAPELRFAPYSYSPEFCPPATGY